MWMWMWLWSGWGWGRTNATLGYSGFVAPADVASFTYRTPFTVIPHHAMVCELALVCIVPREDCSPLLNDQIEARRVIRSFTNGVRNRTFGVWLCATDGIHPLFHDPAVVL
jgi:hypothetical protein